MDIQDALLQRQQQLEEAEALAARLRNEIDTLRAAWEILQQDNPPPAPKQLLAVASGNGDSSARDEPAATPGRILIQEIREAVRVLEPPVSTRAVKDKLQALDPEWFQNVHYASVSGTMRRMAESGELVLVAKGKPGKEATYRLPTPEELEKGRSDGGADEQFTFEGEPG